MKYTSRKEKEDDYRDMPLWKLSYKLSNFENKIFNKIRSGESNSKSNSLRKLKRKRSEIRKIMLEKLKLWEKGKLKEESVSFADIVMEAKEGEKK